MLKMKEPPNKLMIMQVLACFRHDSMILNGLTRTSSGAPCVTRGVLGKIGVTRSSGSVTAILAMLEHGRDACGTAAMPEPGRDACG